MIRVMIVEDEPPILRKLSRMVSGYEPIFSVCALAANGEEALKLIPSTRPDILLTDIHMPLLNGLELTQWCHANALNIEVVVISGYDNFSYAQKSLELGVRSYLLKPIGSEELQDALNLCGKSVLEKNRQKGERLLSKLLLGNLNQLDARFPGFFALGLICAGNFPMAAASEDQIKFDALDLAELGSLLSTFGAWFAPGLTCRECVLLLPLTEDSTANARTLCAQAYALIAKDKAPLKAVWTDPMTTPEDADDVYRQLRRHLRGCCRFGLSENLYLSDNGPPPNDPTSSGELLFCFQHLGLDNFMRRIKDTFDHWATASLTQVGLREQLARLTRLFNRLIDLGHGLSDDEIDLHITEALTNRADYPALHDALAPLFERLYLLHRGDGSAQEDQTDAVSTVEQYILLHLDEPMDSMVLSQICGLTPSYLSKLFKSHTGFSPTDYIIRHRMEKAQEILKSKPGIKVKQLAMRSGYEDQFYFSKLFKKATGLSPGQYKAQLKRNSFTK